MSELIVTEVRADHMDGKLLANFKALPHCETYRRVVSARKIKTEFASEPVSNKRRFEVAPRQ